MLYRYLIANSVKRRYGKARKILKPCVDDGKNNKSAVLSIRRFYFI